MACTICGKEDHNKRTCPGRHIIDRIFPGPLKTFRRMLNCIIVLVVIIVSGAVFKLQLVLPNQSELLFEQIKSGIFLIGILLLIEYFGLSLAFLGRISRTGDSLESIGGFFWRGLRTMFEFSVIYTIAERGESIFSDFMVWIRIYDINLILGLSFATWLLILFIIDISRYALPSKREEAKCPLMHNLPGVLIVRFFVIDYQMNKQWKEEKEVQEMAWGEQGPPSQVELENSPIWEN